MNLIPLQARGLVTSAMTSMVCFTDTMGALRSVSEEESKTFLLITKLHCIPATSPYVWEQQRASVEAGLGGLSTGYTSLGPGTEG